VAKKEPNLLYSTNCVLAYRISKQFYEDLHYVWCSTVFGSLGITGDLLANPASSRPLYRYKTLKAETERGGDAHSDMIVAQRAGIKKGAEEKHKAGKITQDERDEILEVVDTAERSDFKPLTYLMPFAKVKHLLKTTPVSKRAHPLSEEYIIEELPADCFDIIEF